MATDPTPASQPGLEPDASFEEILQRSTSAARYRSPTVVGRGATATVYVARDQALDRDVAIKVLEPTTSAKEVQKFLNEARITASLQHPGILPVYDVAIAEAARPWFSMKRISGRTLAASIEDPPTTENRSARIGSLVSVAIQVAQALAFAHASGVVHQDVKPDNILVGEFGETLLLDWGSAVSLETATANDAYGTPLYMSPEQSRGERPSIVSDVYALGATMFHVLFLRPPTWSESPERFFEMKRSGIIIPPDQAESLDIPRALTSIVLKALAQKPADRYATMSALVQDLANYQAGLAVSSYPDPWTIIALRWYRRYRHRVWAGAAVAAASLVALSVMVIEHRLSQGRWIVYLDEHASAAQGWSEHWRGVRATWFDRQPQACALDGEHGLIPTGESIRIQADDGYKDLVFHNPPAGNLRVEWDCVLDGSPSDMNCFLAGSNRENGYTFHVGGFGIPTSFRISKGTGLLSLFADDLLLPPLQTGKPYHLAMQIEGRQLQFEIDGSVIAQVEDDDEMDVPPWHAFGFDTTSSNVMTISRVRVYRQALAQRTSPLQVADKIAALGHIDQASDEYDQIIAGYPNSELASKALLKRCGIAVSLRQWDLAWTLIGRFEHDFPTSSLRPYSLALQLDLSRLSPGPGSGRPSLDDLRRQLAEFPGHPVQRAVFARDLEARAQGLHLDSAMRGEPLPSTPDDVEAFVHDIKASAQAYRIPFSPALPLIQPALSFLIAHGRAEFVLREAPTFTLECILARLELGQLDAVIGDTNANLDVRAEAMRRRGSDAEVVAGDYPARHRIEAAMALGGPERVTQLFPSQPGAATAYAKLGDGQTALSLAVGNMQRASVLNELGRYEEVVNGDSPPWQRDDALLALGRTDEVLATHPTIINLARVAMFRLRHGDVASARSLVADLERMVPAADSADTVACALVIPAFFSRDDGDATLAEDLLHRALTASQWMDSRRLWYSLAFIAGQITESEFHTQPAQGQIASRLLLARAMRADFAGRGEEAERLQKAWNTLPRWQTDGGDGLRWLTEWRSWKRADHSK